MTHPALLHLPEMKKTKNKPLGLSWPQFRHDNRDQTARLFTFHGHLPLLFLRWTTKVKHNLLNTTKPSNEDQTLTNFCLPRWNSKCLETQKLSGEVFCTVSQKVVWYILQAYSACAPSWTEISLELISSCSGLTNISPDIIPDWPGLWVKWCGLFLQSNMWCALGGCVVSLSDITLACPNTKQDNFVVHPNHSSSGKGKEGSLAACGCPLRNAERLKISLQIPSWIIC